MSEVFDIYTIIFLAVAVVIFLRLRSVLGRRTGNERQPFDPYSAPDAPKTGKQGKTPSDTVVELPGRTATATARAKAERWKDFAKPGSAQAKTFNAFAELDPGFDPRAFLEGAKMAYEMIVTAFAAGDSKALRPLLSKEVFDGFAGAIAEREERGEEIQSNFIGIDRADIIDASLKGTIAQVTVKITSKLISATLSKTGEVIEGDPQKVCGVVDIWTFARDLTLSNPNWKLVATEAS